MSDDLCITDRVLSTPRDDHQSATVWTEIRNGPLPGGKIAGWIIATAVENAFLQPGFAFHQVTPTLRTQGTGFIHKRAAIAAFWKS